MGERYNTRPGPHMAPHGPTCGSLLTDSRSDQQEAPLGDRGPGITILCLALKSQGSNCRGLF